MEENRKQKPSDFKDISDDQERLSFQLSSIWDREPIDSQKIMRELHKLKLMQVILYSLIIFGIIAIFNFILQSINLIIIIIDIIIVAIYLICLKYTYALRKHLKIKKEEYQKFVKVNKKREIPLKLVFIFYSLIIIVTTFILILSEIKINPLILILIVCFSLLFFYFDTDVEHDNSSKI